MTENNKRDGSFINGLTYLLIGGGIGAALALLFAPKSGSEFRGEIADATRKGYDATLEKAGEIKAQSVNAFDTVKEKASAVIEFASAKINTGTDAVSDVVSATTGAVADGIERMQNESAPQSKQPVNGRKSTNVV
jgi:gas vesicle protein